MITVKPGKIEDKAIWAENRVPGPDDVLIINHPVTINASIHVWDVMIWRTGSLTFNPLRSIALTCEANFNCSGTLTQQPKSEAIKHDIKLLTAGSGLIFSGEGVYNGKGTFKTQFVHASIVYKGQTKFIVNEKPTNWKPGDRIVIAPMEEPSVYQHWLHYDDCIIKSIKGNVIEVTEPFKYDHKPVVDQDGTYYYPEVIMLSRNVRISGTPNAKAYVLFEETNKPQKFSDIEISNVGGENFGLHFKSCRLKSIGSVLSGIVVHTCDNHAFVPDRSDGIILSGCTSHDTKNCAYWWLSPPNNSASQENNSNFIEYLSCIASKTYYTRPYSLASFKLAGGTGNRLINCRAIGNQGAKNSGGVVWGEDFNYMPNEWEVDNIISHNHQENGTFNWQNDPSRHVVKGVIAFNCKVGIMDGAYHNAYHYVNCKLFNNGFWDIVQHALPIRTGPRNGNGYIKSYSQINCQKGMLILKHTLPDEEPILFFASLIPTVEIDHTDGVNPGFYDFFNCGFSYKITKAVEGTKIRVQDDDSIDAFLVDSSGNVYAIQPFITLKT